jgi:spermidine/putrescine transport system substrate-binding protein
MPVTPSTGPALGRRDVLRRGGLLAALAVAGPSVLAACGSASTSAATPPAVGNKVGGDLNFLSWEGYDLADSKLMQQWEKQHGVTMNPTYISTSDDVQAKLKSGSSRSIHEDGRSTRSDR